jgi:hypothetical protein
MRATVELIYILLGRKPDNFHARRSAVATYNLSALQYKVPAR